MPSHRYFLTDFVTIQRQSFFELLEKGLIEEFSKRNPITNTKKDLEFVFYPEYYILTRPEYTPQEAIIKNKSYTSKLFVPGQLTDFKSKKKIVKWFYIGNIPIMTKRGHFILNGAARVIVNQILRSPGIYYQQKIYENYQEKWSQKPDDSYKRFYADLICMRGTWLRIEIDKEKNIWAQMKKGPKIPMYWFLLAMGLSEKKIFKTITDSFRLLGNLKNVSDLSNKQNDTIISTKFENNQDTATGPEGATEINLNKNENENENENDNETKKMKKISQTKKYTYLKSPPEAWIEIYKLLSINTVKKKKETSNDSTSPFGLRSTGLTNKKQKELLEFKEAYFKKQLSSSPSLRTSLRGPLLPFGAKQTEGKGQQKYGTAPLLSGLVNNQKSMKKSAIKTYLAEEGRKWLYNKFMNPRSYNLGKQGRLSFNKKLGLNILPNQTTLTGLDVLYATDYLIKVEKGIFKIDDIDHLKNRRVRTSGELIQIQVGIGLVRLEKSIRENLNKITINEIFDFSPTDFKKFKQIDNQNSFITNKLVTKKTNKIENDHSRTLSVVQTKNPAAKQPLGFAAVLRNPKLLSSGPFLPFAANQTEGKGQKKPELKNYFQLKKSINSPFYSPFEYSFSTLLEIACSHSLTEAKPFGNLSVASFSNPSRDLQPLATQPNGFPVAKQGTGTEGKEEANRREGETQNDLILTNFINSKAFNSAIREFFGTSPLSQFMDQINPLAELTHKRRLSSMGPGGVTRDTATLAIRGIHPTHYGRICPIETPEGKNTGLVNSMTTYARVNLNGIIESPFYKVYKGQVQKNTGMYFFSAEQEEQIRLAAADLSTSSIGFLPKSLIPVRIAEEFTKIPRTQVQFVGVSPLQMISVATSLIPFLEHDDANRALMGSNMQRQAVPLIKPERPIVGTGLEARTISDSGHVIIAKSSGFVTYVSSDKIIIHSLCF